MSDDLQLQLVAAFPAETDANVIRALTEGILLADGLMDSEPFLRNVVGRDLRGHLRRAGILYRLHDLCRLGDLPFEAVMGKMPRGSWHWLELRSQRFTAHPVRTDGPYAFPDDTATRQDERLRNQNDLFEPNFLPLAQQAEFVPGLSVWLTFGGGLPGQLQHVAWAMPSADGQDWLAHINVLRRAAVTGGASPDVSAPKALNLRFKEHIEEALSGRLGRPDRAAK